MYKLLLADFDGTLVGPSPQFSISEGVITAIKNFSSRYIFSLATGRQYFDFINQFAKTFQLKHPIIVNGGAQIIDPISGKELYSEFIPDSSAKNLINYLLENRIPFVVEKPGFFYRSTHEYMRPFPEGIEVKDVADLTITQIPKIVVHAKFNEEEINKLYAEFTKTFTDMHISKIQSMERTKFGFDITSLKASKHIAALKLFELLGIKPEEVVGMGDSYNDYPLLTACGVKVAMGNAPQELKDIADFICPPQKEDGVLKVIEKYF